MDATDNSSLIGSLELELSKLAYRWRTASHRGNLDEAEEILQNYHATFARMWGLGWNGGSLLPDIELPEYLMPEYFVNYWKNKDLQRLERLV